MTAGVIDCLKAIQIQIAKHVSAAASMRILQRVIETAFEFSPVQQTRQRIVSRLIGILARQASQFGDVMQHDHCAIDTLALVVSAAIASANR